MGYNDEAIFIAFANTTNKKTTEQIRLNRDVIPWSHDRAYPIIIYDNNGKKINSTMKNGILPVTLPAGGVSCIQVNGIHPATANNKGSDKLVSIKGKNRFLRYSPTVDSTATVTAMIIQPVESTAYFYAYANKTEKEWKECSLRYRLNNSETWTTVSDKAYPFEFDIALPEIGDAVLFEITAIKSDGSRVNFPVKIINN
jgi:hypothetical protein